MDAELYQIVDYILNKADDAAVEVVIAALKKRGEKRVNFANINPDALARDMAQTLQSQMGFDLDGIRSMVKDMVVNIIRNEAPELDDSQIAVLLENWMPQGQRPEPEELPPDVLMQMLKQFMAFSTGSMSMTELQQLESELPGWKEKYFARFSPTIRTLVKLTLEAQIDLDDFWQQIQSMLYAEEA